MRARVLIVVAVVATIAWLGYRHRTRPAQSPEQTDTGAPAGGVAEPSAAQEPHDAGALPPLAEPTGTELSITLLAAPAGRYAARDADDDADGAYRTLVESFAQDGTRYDRDLSRAAREVAYQSAVLGKPPPEAVLTAVLHATGAAEISAMQLILQANSDDPSVMRETVRRAMSRPMGGYGLIRVGIGEVATPDEELSHRITVLVTRRAYEIEPALRHSPLNGHWTLRGLLPPGYSDAKAWALYPDGRMQEVALDVTGRNFELRAPTGDREGTMYVSISGSDQRGPGKLLQLSVEVGHEPPRTLTINVSPADPDLPDLAAAERHALDVLNADRARFGLAPLAIDEQLSAVARAHSADMRANGFFAHLSPTTGLASDRLAAVGYRTRTHAENIALNDSITEAEASLLGSIGHRRNILNARFTHVGIGLAKRVRGDDTDWHVTQLFARPVLPLDIDRSVAELLMKINARRAEAGAGALHRDADFSAVAQRNARLAADGKLEGLAERTAAELRELSHGSATISVHAAYDLSRFDPPAISLDESMATIGIGVHQSETELHGRIGVVLIVTPD